MDILKNFSTNFHSLATNPINFYESYQDGEEKHLLRTQTEELIGSRGIPCLHLTPKEGILIGDSLYHDNPHTLYLNDFLVAQDTFILIDFQHITTQLYTEGWKIIPNTNFIGSMKISNEEDVNPEPGDYIILKREYEGIRYIFKVSAVSNFKDICLQVSIVVATFDSIDMGGISSYA
jgi:hypothetical protein